ncbi:MAG: alpha/beta hydrolase [Clostridia bacterium]|nr:alpha/beta hydrolase [Clostridia bacterium]
MKKLLLILLIFLIIFLSALCLVFAGLFSGHEMTADVKYGEGEGETMDVYLPKRGIDKENAGCVIFLHGGSWTGGDKSEERLRCAYLSNHGYIAASINYALYSEHSEKPFTVDMVMDEIDAAIARLCEFAAERGIRITKAATAGYSAGAHLSLLYAYSRADTAPVEIAFASGMGAPADLDSSIWGSRAITIIKRLSGITITEEELEGEYAQELLSSLSPVSYITKDSPPTLFMYGGKDETVSIANAESLKAGLSEAGVSYEYILQKNAGHGLINNPIKRYAYNRALVDFCDRYF